MPKLVPNRPRLDDVQKALLSAPKFTASLGLTEEDLSNFGDNEENPPLGQGHYAYAYALPDGGVLKITDDPDDAAAADLIRRANESGEYPVGLLHVRAVKRFKDPVYWNETDKNETRDLYAVVTETVQPLRAYVREALARVPRPEDASIKGLLGMMVVEHVWTMEAAASDDRGPEGMGEEMREFARGIIEKAPVLAAMLDEVMQGVRWLSLHGFDVIDLHPGNFGRATGHRTVLFDFGHGSRSDSTPLPEPALATNGVPMPKVRAAFAECFDDVEEQFPDFGALELHQDEKAGADNGHGSERQFGYCMDGKPIRIAFAAKTEDLPVANIRGLVAHEFGHALDYRYGSKLDGMLGERLPKGVERRADAIAQAVFGRTIKYDARQIQCVGCRGTSPRPKKLGP